MISSQGFISFYIKMCIQLQIIFLLIVVIYKIIVNGKILPCKFNIIEPTPLFFISTMFMT
jgi:hypothetical protein